LLPGKTRTGGDGLIVDSDLQVGKADLALRHTATGHVGKQHQRAHSVSIARHSLALALGMLAHLGAPRHAD
jgi:hypothetical protein